MSGKLGKVSVPQQHENKIQFDWAGIHQAQCCTLEVSCDGKCRDFRVSTVQSFFCHRSLSGYCLAGNFLLWNTGTTSIFHWIQFEQNDKNTEISTLGACHAKRHPVPLVLAMHTTNGL